MGVFQRLTLVQATSGYLVQRILKNNLATMVSKLGFETPTQLFNSIKPNKSAENCHKEWYTKINGLFKSLVKIRDLQ